MQAIIGLVFGAAGVTVMTYALYELAVTGELVIAGHPVNFAVDPAGGALAFGLAAGFVCVLIAASAAMVHCGAHAVRAMAEKARPLSGRV